MAKLKFDRNINVVLDNNEQTEVPKDEVWKGTRSGLADINGVAVNAGLGYGKLHDGIMLGGCLLYTSPSPRDRTRSRMPSSA